MGLPKRRGGLPVLATGLRQPGGQQAPRRPERFHTQGTCGFVIGLRPVPSANDPRQKGPADTKRRDLTALPAGWAWACTNRGSAVGRPARRFHMQ